jgi:hypothetical protein
VASSQIPLPRVHHCGASGVVGKDGRRADELLYRCCVDRASRCRMETWRPKFPGQRAEDYRGAPRALGNRGDIVIRCTVRHHNAANPPSSSCICAIVTTRRLCEFTMYCLFNLPVCCLWQHQIAVGNRCTFHPVRTNMSRSRNAFVPSTGEPVCP